MPYITQAEILSDIPPQTLLEALDDDGDGVADADAWDKVEAAAAEAIDGPLSQRYSTPFVTVPPFIKFAARVLVLEKLYLRRGLAGDANPWTSQAKGVRAKLDLIAAGKEPLSPEVNKPKPSISAITEPAGTTLKNGGILA